MYNFKKNAKAYIVYYDNAGAVYRQYQVEIYNDITASQTFDEQGYKQKTLHSLVSVHEKATLNSANPANFSFTTPLLSISEAPIFLTLGGDCSAGNLSSFDLYIESDNIIYKLTKCVIEQMAYNIERTSILTVSIAGTASKLEKYGNVGSVTIPGTPLTYGVKSYIPISKLKVALDNVTIDSISGISLNINNEISWYPSKTVNQALAGTTMYPSSYILQGRSFSGSITQFLTSENSDIGNDTSVSSQVIVQIYSDLYSVSTPILQFNFPSTSLTRRVNFEELIDRIYDFRLNSNSGSLVQDYTTVVVAIFDRDGNIIMDRFNDSIFARS
jgi:Phage tail tube protein